MGRIIGGGEGEIRKNEREEKEFMNERVRLRIKGKGGN